MSKRSRRQRLLPASLITLASLALSRLPLAAQIYRQRKSLQRKTRALLHEESPAPPAQEKETPRRARWVTRLYRVANRVDYRIDRIKARIGERYGSDDPYRIVAYRGFGTDDTLYLMGRIIEDEGITPATEKDSIWRNLVNVYKRFESDEVPGARVRALFQGCQYETTTNEEGYFEFWITPPKPLSHDRLWHEVALELLSPLREGQPAERTTGYVLVPPPSARFGVISDVDDTIVQTNATSLLKMARTVFLGNVHTRIPFAGVAAFYEALQSGATGREFNPLFYVSSSPWNLYDLAAEFLEIQDIPLGPLLLRDWGISNDEVLPTKHAPHKRKSISRLLDTFDKLPFILIGDSGQEDPEIYSEVVNQYPDRILAVYIRNVSPNPARSEAIRTLASNVAEAGSTLILADDTLAAARHAAEQAWIAEAMLPQVRTQVAVDKSDLAPGEDEAPTVVIEGEKGSVLPPSSTTTTQTVDNSAIAGDNYG